MSYREAEHVTMLRDSLRKFVDVEIPRELAATWDRDDYFARDVFDKLGPLGVGGLTVPEEYGGVGEDVTATMAVIEELAKRSCGFAVSYILCSCYGGMNISDAGSEQQKRDLLPRVAECNILFSYGFSEPDIGGDVASVKTTAVRKDDRLVINGQKRFCTGASVCDYIFCVVRSGPVEDRYNNLSLVMVPPDTPGVTVQPMNTLGMRGMPTCDVFFDDVEVSDQNILGGPSQWNNAWPVLAGRALEVERLEVSALTLGIAAAAVADTVDYAQQRSQFGRLISGHQAIRHVLSNVETTLRACELMLYSAAALADSKQPCAVETSMAKLFIGEQCRDIAIKCQEVMGAYGCVEGYDMERYVRELLQMPIIGGSSNMQRNNIANQLGIARR